MDGMRQYGIEQSLRLARQGSLRDGALSYFGRGFSYRALFAQGESCARAFARWGVKAGDAVFLCASALPELVHSLLALWRLGALPHILHPAMRKEEMTSALAQGGARLFVLFDQLYPHCEAAAEQQDRCTVVLLSATSSMPFLLRHSLNQRLPSAQIRQPGQILWKDFLSSGQFLRQAPRTAPKSDLPALIYYREGQPQALSYEALPEILNRPLQCAALPEGSARFLSLLPPWHPAGVSFGLLAPLFLGMELILESRQRRDSLLETLRQEAPSNLLLGEEQRHWLQEAGAPFTGAFHDKDYGICWLRREERT